MKRAGRILLLLNLAFAAASGRLVAQSASDEAPFAIRGVLPWHNFLSGPSAWNLEDYERYLDDCKAKQINFIGFHNYTGGGQRYVTYVEPLIKIEYKNILPEAFLDNSLTARWGYEPRAIQDFAFNTSRLFPAGTEAFGSDCTTRPANKAEQYRCAQELMRQVMRMAHDRGMQTAMGFEFGVHPPELFSLYEDGLYWEGTGSMIPNPAHYQAVEILHATIDNILDAYPDLDWIWLWLNEHSFFGFDADLALKNLEFKSLYDRHAGLFEGLSTKQKLIGVWSLQYITLAYEHIKTVAPGKKVLIGGWGGNDQLPAILRGLDRGLPTDIVFSCLNPGLGQYPQPHFIAEIARHRRFWSIPWLEGDHQLWHYQPRVNIVREQVKLAREMKLDGVLAIHWRTEEVKINFAAFSRFALNPADPASVTDIYRSFLEQECGTSAARELAPLFARMDEEMWLGQASSPEYYLYTPDWGRLDLRSREKFQELAGRLEKVSKEASNNQQREAIGWYRNNVDFALLLDEVGRKMEPGHALRKRYYATDPPLDPQEIARALPVVQKSLKEAPLEKLFTMYASRVRSRGELGVLSSMNQKLYGEYKELERFLAGLNK